MGHINFAPTFKLDLSVKGLQKLFSAENLKKLKFNRFVMTLFAAAILMLMLIFGVIQKFRLDHVLTEKEKVRIETANMKRGLTPTETIDTGHAEKNNVLEKFEKRIIWSVVLNELSQSVPQRIWLKSIEGGSKADDSVMLSGEAPDQFAVSTMINSLQKAGYFEDIQLVSSDVVKGSKSSAVLFKVRFKALRKSNEQTESKRNVDKVN